MPVGFVTEAGAVITRRSRRVMVSKNGEVMADWELSRLEGLCLWGGVNITRPAMIGLLKAGVEMTLVTSDGRLMGQLIPPKSRNALLRFEQYRSYDSEARRLEIARQVCRAKVVNARGLLLRSNRGRPRKELAEIADRLNDGLRLISQADSLPRLLGLEGHAARLYFSVFTMMLRTDLKFEGRSRRPPRDPVNALLSLGYTFLVRELTALSAAIGFDPYIGFLHAIDYGRMGLPLDLAEPFRPALIDRMVISLVNNKVFSAGDCENRNGGCYLGRDGFKKFATHYERYLARRREDPLSRKRFSLRQHLRLQVERFAGYIKEDAEPYFFAIEG